MNYLFQMTIDDYLEIVRRAQANGVKPGESMEKEFLEYAKEKGLKPIGATELNRDELLREHASKGKKILDIRTQKDGKQEIRIAEPGEDKCQ